MSRFFTGWLLLAILAFLALGAMLPKPSWPAVRSAPGASAGLPSPDLRWTPAPPGRCYSWQAVRAAISHKLGGVVIHHVSWGADGAVSVFHNPGVPVRYHVRWRGDMECVDAVRQTVGEG